MTSEKVRKYRSSVRDKRRRSRTRRQSISNKSLLLCLLDLVGETKIGPVFSRHKLVIHSAGKVILYDVSTHCVLVLIVEQTAHIFDHELLADTLMVQWKATFIRWYGRKYFLRECVRGHHYCVFTFIQVSSLIRQITVFTSINLL